VYEKYVLCTVLHETTQLTGNNNNNGNASCSKYFDHIKTSKFLVTNFSTDRVVNTSRPVLERVQPILQNNSSEKMKSKRIVFPRCMPSGRQTNERGQQEKN
jgi:hypothetical protein